MQKGNGIEDEVRGDVQTTKSRPYQWAVVGRVRVGRAFPSFVTGARAGSSTEPHDSPPLPLEGSALLFPKACMDACMVA